MTLKDVLMQADDEISKKDEITRSKNSKIARLKNENMMLKHYSKERNVKINAIKSNMRNSTQTKLREYFTTTQTEEEVETF